MDSDRPAAAGVSATSGRGRQRTRQLRMLAEASLAINLAASPEEMLQVVTDRGRALIGARYSVSSMVEDGNWARALTAVSPVRGSGHRRRPDGAGIEAEVCRTNRPLRLTRAAIERHPAWRRADTEADPPVRGWLAAPLVGRDGRNLGLVQLWDKEQGSFTEEDEAILVQLAQMASVVLEHVRLQQQAAAAAAAVQADLLKTELLNTVSHELRTPLAAIKGFTTTLLMYLRRLPRKEQISFLQEIDAACDRLTELVENLLHLARLEAGTLKIEREPVALSGVLHAAVEDARRRHPQREISLSIAPDLPPVLADARRLGQVVANLVDNAVKFSPAGGPVAVDAAMTAQGEAAFSVTDRGIGIAAEHQARVFERFYRVDTGLTRDIGGTGLGLAICRRIAQEHGGRIELHSVENAGSTFTVTLPPLERGAQDRARAAARGRPPGPGSAA